MSSLARARARRVLRFFRNSSVGRPRYRFAGYRPRVSTDLTPEQLSLVNFKRTVADFFTNERYSFAKELPSGIQGGAIVISERDELGLQLRKLVAKFGNSRFDDEDLRSEIGWLSMLKGAPHIVQIVTTKNIRPHPQKTQIPRRPILVTEYVPNGTLGDMMERVEESDGDAAVPNRILWFIFLCLARGITALAYPLGNFGVGFSEEVPIEDEFIPAGTEPINLVHGDLHLNNVVVGELDPRHNEHWLCPIIKLIDFGAAKQLTLTHPRLGNKTGIAENIFSVGRVMQELADRLASAPPLEAELRDLINRCLKMNLMTRPSLEELEKVLEEGIRSGSLDYQEKRTPVAFNESTIALERWVREFIFDAKSESTGRRLSI
ncbi:hypothetical protein DL769_004499 [Monosporascus sp. CRB-8-3]|nr:hypothetical protein DL769_004499 [Monosporascus sp. CRB-8-3]